MKADIKADMISDPKSVQKSNQKFDQKSDQKSDTKAAAKRIRNKPLIVCIAVPLLTGGLSSLLTMGGMAAFSQLQKPPLTPADWVFPVAWSILYVLMGVASYLVYTANATPQMRYSALIAYGVTLVFNFVWPLLFFRLGMRLVALMWLLLLLGLVALTASIFGRVRKSAGVLLLPYLVWTAFAAYLNLGVYLLNR